MLNRWKGKTDRGSSPLLSSNFERMTMPEHEWIFGHDEKAEFAECVYCGRFVHTTEPPPEDACPREHFDPKN